MSQLQGSAAGRASTRVRPMEPTTKPPRRPSLHTTPNTALIAAAPWTGDTALMRGSIRIDVSERKLYHYRDGGLRKTYSVAVGMPEYPTPRGSFRIISKVVNPTWTPPDSDWAEGMEPVGPGPGNPLGTRWMGSLAQRGYPWHLHQQFCGHRGVPRLHTHARGGGRGTVLPRVHRHPGRDRPLGCMPMDLSTRHPRK